MALDDDDALPGDDAPEPKPTMRLQKYLAAAGLGSRRACEDLIREGHVTVDGKLVEDMGLRIDPRKSVVEVDFERVKPQPRRYYVVNKPGGYLSTSRDPGGRPRVLDLIPPGTVRLYTVGRLDEESEGLILVTNDGDLAQKLAHPSFQVPRRYQVQVVGRPSKEALEQLKRGLFFTEGKFRVERISVVGMRGRSTLLEIEMRTGRNREIRRLLARIGHKVIHLKRMSFGPIQLGGLGLGKARQLREGELKALRDLVSGKAPARDTRPRRRPEPKAAEGEEAPAPRRSPARAPGPPKRPGKPRPAGRLAKTAGGRAGGGRSTGRTTGGAAPRGPRPAKKKAAKRVGRR